MDIRRIHIRGYVSARTRVYTWIYMVVAERSRVPVGRIEIYRLVGETYLVAHN